MKIMNVGAMALGYLTLAIVVWWSVEPHVTQASEPFVRWLRSEILWRRGLRPPPYETLPGRRVVERV